MALASSPATVIRAYGILAAILDVAVRDRRLGENPIRGIKLPKKQQKRRVYLSHRQVELLAHQPQLPDLIVFLKSPEQLVFGNGDEHVRLPNSQDGWFAGAVRRAQKIDPDFPRISPHVLRHTAASLAIRAGANVKAVQRMLGHASAAMTLDTYADLFDDDLDYVADALSRARGAQRTVMVAKDLNTEPARLPRTRPGPRRTQSIVTASTSFAATLLAAVLAFVVAHVVLLFTGADVQLVDAHRRSPVSRPRARCAASATSSLWTAAEQAIR